MLAAVAGAHRTSSAIDRGAKADRFWSSSAWQATVITAVGPAVGPPLGVVVGRWSWLHVEDRLGIDDDTVIPLTVALIIPPSLAAASAMGWLPGRRAARLRQAHRLRAE